MDIRNVLKTFVLFLDGIIGLVIIMVIMVPLWLVNILWSWSTKLLVKAQTQKMLNPAVPDNRVNRYYKLYYRIKWVRRQLARGYYYGINHLKPLEDRDEYKRD